MRRKEQAKCRKRTSTARRELAVRAFVPRRVTSHPIGHSRLVQFSQVSSRVSRTVRILQCLSRRAGVRQAE